MPCANVQQWLRSSMGALHFDNYGDASTIEARGRTTSKGTPHNPEVANGIAGTHYFWDCIQVRSKLWRGAWTSGRFGKQRCSWSCQFWREDSFLQVQTVRKGEGCQEFHRSLVLSRESCLVRTSGRPHFAAYDSTWHSCARNILVGETYIIC